MSKEIKKQVDELCLQLEQTVVPGMFVLNKQAAEITEKIEKLQSECHHNFVDGQCEYCYKEES